MTWPSNTKPRRLSVRRIPGDDIAMGCRVRLARNLSRHVFPDRATGPQRAVVLKKIMGAAQAEMPEFTLSSLDTFSEEERLLVFEERLISKELMERESGAGIMVSKDNAVSAMINEEDHLRIQGFAACMDIETAWRRADAFDTQLDGRLEYAWSPRWGYLTACPSNLGTGMRVSVMFHLIGLRMTGDLDATIRGLERMRLLVRGIYGEGSESSGNMFQVSNMDTLGMDENAIITRTKRICEELVRQERNARARVISESPLAVEDALTRALCLLKNALLMPSGEAGELLSAIRFGASVGLITDMTVEEVDRLMMRIQPAHLQNEMAMTLSSEQRDEFRAVLLTAQLAKANLRKVRR
ncbi:MAG: ATP--guanido phosphotransferase [Kiritimatiellaeota bacterium]|nr:ATP--guanido phosphotransferase [Kiritimatiellota bacterium]